MRLLYGATIAAVALGVLGLFALAAPSRPAAASGPANTDPRHGWVALGGTSVGKVCDGPNLVYRARSNQGLALTVSPADPQCAP